MLQKESNIRLKLLQLDEEGLVEMTEEGIETWTDALTPQIDFEGVPRQNSDPSIWDAGFPDCLSDLGWTAQCLKNAADEMIEAAEHLEKVEERFKSEMKIAELAEGIEQSNEEN